MGRRKKIIIDAETSINDANVKDGKEEELQEVTIETNDDVVNSENNEEQEEQGSILDGLVEEETKKPVKKVTNKTYNAKVKELEKVVTTFNTKLGSDYIRRQAIQQFSCVDVTSTGVLSLDWALGVGGIIGGRIYEIFGDYGSGKSCLTFSIIGEFQKRQKTCAFIDAEHTFDPTFAKKFGLDIDKLYISEPNCMEDTFEIIYAFVESGAMDLIVVDSAAALVPKKILEGEEKAMNQIGVDAQIMNKHLNKLNGKLGGTKTVVMFINQIYERIGDMYAQYKEPATKKGKALKYFSTVRVEVQKNKVLKNADDEEIGNTSTMIVRKNKASIPMRKARPIVLNYIKGYDKEIDIIVMAEKFKLLEKKAGWIICGEERVNGIKVFKDLLKTNSKFKEDLVGKIRVIIMENKDMTDEKAEIVTDIYAKGKKGGKKDNKKEEEEDD